MWILYHVTRARHNKRTPFHFSGFKGMHLYIFIKLNIVASNILKYAINCAFSSNFQKMQDLTTTKHSPQRLSDLRKLWVHNFLNEVK